VATSQLVFAPFGYQFHVNQHFNRHNRHALAGGWVIQHRLQLCSQRHRRQVIYADAFHLNGHTRFEGDKNALMFKGFFANEKVNSGGGANVAMSANGQSTRQRIADVEMGELIGRFHGRLSYFGGNKLENLFQFHHIHLTTWGLGIRVLHGASVAGCGSEFQRAL
jgi:hypothetical protein